MYELWELQSWTEIYNEIFENAIFFGISSVIFTICAYLTLQIIIVSYYPNGIIMGTIILACKIAASLIIIAIAILAFIAQSDQKVSSTTYMFLAMLGIFAWTVNKLINGHRVLSARPELLAAE